MAKRKTTVQSNQITLAKLTVTSVYEKKILYRIVESLSGILRGKLTEEKIGVHKQYNEDMFKQMGSMVYALADLDGNRNYPRVKEALKKLRQRDVCLILPDGCELNTGIITQFKSDKNADTVEIWFSIEMYQTLLNSSLGYTIYETLTAMSFNSIYTMKIYELLAKWRGNSKFNISVNELRFLTDTQDKFKQIGEFTKNVLDVSKRQLDDSDLTDLKFKYRAVKKGRSIVSFDIYPILTENSFEENQLLEASPRWDLSAVEIQNFNRLGIELKGKTHELIKLYLATYGNIELMNNVERYANIAIQKGAKSVAAYVVSCLKKELENYKQPSSIGEEKDEADMTRAELQARALQKREEYNQNSALPNLGDLFSIK